MVYFFFFEVRNTNIIRKGSKIDINGIYSSLYGKTDEK